MKLKLIISTLMFTIMCANFSVAQYAVKFTVTDSTGIGEPFATVRIFHESDSVKAARLGTTDSNGKYNETLAKTGEYQIKISSVGKTMLEKRFEISKSKPYVDLGTLILENAATTLGEVEVLAQKPLVKTEIDRLVYDIESDEDSKTNSIFEMLRKVPLVTVDGQENITVNGNSNFKIYKNGRPNSSWSNNPKEVLKSIPASMIKSIEVITEPGAKYDAEGVAGILNIITTDNTIIKGVVGGISAGASTRGRYNASTYMTMQVGKFTTSFNYGFHSFSGKSNEYTQNTERVYLTTGNKETTSSYSTNPGYIHFGNIEASYEVDSLNLMTFAFGGYYYSIKNDGVGSYLKSDPSGNIINSYKNTSRIPGMSYFDFNGKFDYQHLTKNKGESLIFSYLLSTTNQDSESESEYYDVVNMPGLYEWQSNDSELKFYEHTFQVDWTRPFNNGHKIELGAKYILRVNDSNTLMKYDGREDASTDFNHTTQVGALYSEYSYNTRNWGARAGLRYEYSYLSAKFNDGSNPNFHNSLNDIVPTLSINYKFNDQNSVKLNYATRINRPGINYLNPAIYYTPTTVSQGNPDLESTRRHSLSLTYSLIKPKVTLNASLNGNYASNIIMNKSQLIDEIEYNSYGNFGKNIGFSFSTYFRWQISSKSDIMVNGLIGVLRIKNKDMNISNSGITANVFTQYTHTLPWELRLGAYFGAQKQGVINLYDSQKNMTYFYGMSLSKSFLKEKRMTVRISADSPFMKNLKYKQRTENIDYISDLVSRYVSQNFSISISYRFGSLNATVKKTNKTIENSDLEGKR